MNTYDEYTALVVTARFRNRQREVIPATVHYKLRNKSTNSTLIDWTEIPADNDVSVSVSAQTNVANRYAREELELTIAANKDTANQVTKQTRWYVNNRRATS
jgi:hypothetical protein